MLGIDVSGKLNNALNGLNFVKAFATAYNSSGGLSKEKVSILHMEAFLFLMAHQDQDGIPLLDMQKALGYAQAKMQRIAVTLQNVGWITLKKGPQDGRQRIVNLTEQGLALFDQLSPCFSEEKNDFTYQAASEKMKASIADKAVEREALLNAENILARAPAVAKASMNVAVEVKGLSAMGAVGASGVKAEESAVRKHLQKRNKEIAMLKGKLREVLEDKKRGDYGKIEIGAGYVRTEHLGIVTHKVLLKRLFDLNVSGEADAKAYPPSMRGVVAYLQDASNHDYRKMLTPTPKTKRERLDKEAIQLQYEIDGFQAAIHDLITKFGQDQIWEFPHLKGMHHNLNEKLQKTQALLTLTKSEIAGLDAKEEMNRMLKELEEMPDLTPEQEDALAEIENKFDDRYADFDVTEFPTTGETEKE